MSTPRKRRSSKSKAKKKTSDVALSRQRKLEILGLVLMALALLLSLAVVTHSRADDTMLDRESMETLLAPGDNRAENLLGPIGAIVSRALVTDLLGFPVLILLGVLFAWGYVLLRQKTPLFLPMFTGLAFAGSFFLACLMGWIDARADAPLDLWSGALGAGVSGWIEGLVGPVGAFVVLALAVVVVVLLVWDRDIQASLDRAEGAVGGLGSGLAASWASYREGAAERRDLRQKALAERAADREKSRKEKEKSRLPKEKTRSPEKAARDREKAQEAQRQLREIDSRPTPPVPEAPPSETPAFAGLPPADPANLPGGGDGMSVNVHTGIEEETADLDAARGDSGRTKVRPNERELAYDYPSIELLEESDTDAEVDLDEIEENKQILLDKLETYNIQIEEIDAVVGPTVTRYELTPAAGVKISRITALENDLAMALAAAGIRIIAPIPGKSSIGVEIPNRSREMVRLRQTLEKKKFRDAGRGGGMALPVPIGKTIEGETHLVDLAKMPHLLIAGATGSGKSVGINTLIAGLLYAKHPADLKFVMVDPKKIELNTYATLLDHFVAMPEDGEEPITTDFAQAAAVLRSCEREMEIRYDLLAEAGVRGISEYNKKVASGKLADLGPKHRHLPYIVVVVDELADLMMTSAKEVEAPIARLAQMARAVGVHLVIATQRPSVDVITGLIKANFPSRIAYQTSSKIDSRTIIDGGGAEQLVGNGDCLYMNGSRITRLQGPFVSVGEIEAIADHIGGQEGAGPYLLPPMEPGSDAPEGAAGANVEDRDDLFEDAAKVIVRSQQGSVSLLQRKLSVGYTRAARLVDQLEEAGIVGPFEGSKAREVLVANESQLDALLSGETNVEDVSGDVPFDFQ
ncbi:MAG: DNA translocase FtsK [Bacteroidota bacterium]